MDRACAIYKVHPCSMCPGDTEYFCKSCPCSLCVQCKENHIKDLKTKYHNVMGYRDKFKYIPTEDICAKNPQVVYRRYCEPCDLPVGVECTHQKDHNTRDIGTTYKTK